MRRLYCCNCSTAAVSFSFTAMFRNRYRYFILLLGWICLTSISSNMLSFNFAIICMSPSANENSSDGFLSSSNATSKAPKLSSMIAPMIHYTTKQKAWLNWMVGVGSLLGTFPFSWLCTHYGARYVLLGAGLLSAVSTALIPWAAFQDFNLFLFLRFLQGIAYSADFATIGVICSQWASVKQYALFIAVLTCFTPLSTTITNAVSGVICESRFGWPMVYYSHAAVCLGLFVLWTLFYHDEPKKIRSVSEVELEKIHRNKTKAQIEGTKSVPYKAILTDKVILVIWLNAFADLFTFVYVHLYIPTYFKYVLKFGLQETGFLGALPTLVNIPVRIVSGYISDSIRCTSEQRKLIAFNSISVAIPGLIFLLIGLVATKVQPIVVVLLFTFIDIFFAPSAGGFYKCGAFYSRQYYHFVVAKIQFVKSLSLFLAPLMVAIFVHDEADHAQWRTIFFIFFGLLFTANLLFCFVATDKPADFTYDPVTTTKTTQKTIPS